MVLLSIDNLSVSFYTPRGEIEAVRDVSFTLNEGEILGIVGESGCGKSILCKSIMKLLPDIARIKSGHITAAGTDITDYSEREMTALRGSFAAYVFQNPMTMLNPTLTVGRQLEEALRQHDRAVCGRAVRKEARGGCKSDKTDGESLRIRAIRLLKLVGIEHADRCINMYPHEFSGGMRQRAVIAIALAEEPKLIFADEPTTALDARIGEQILSVFDNIRHELGTSIVFVSHDLSAVRRIADRIIVMYAGKIAELGRTEEIFASPLHPYTRALLRTLPEYNSRAERLYEIPGMPPSLINPPKGDAFALRNEHACSRDITEQAPLIAVGDTHAAATFELMEAKEGVAARGTDSICGSTCGEQQREQAIGIGKVKDYTYRGQDASMQSASANSSVLLDIRQLSYAYHMAQDGRSVQAIDDVSIEVCRGEIYGIIGESGSGKSTLAKCIMSILRPDSGSIIYDGMDICDKRIYKRNRRRLQISRQLIFQDSDSALNPKMRIADIITEPMRINHIGQGGYKDEALRLMQAVGLGAEYADKYPSELSGGQRQRVAIARAISVRPELIIADEALASLDASVQAQIVNLFKRMQAEYGFTLIFISHDMHMVRYLCSRAAVLEHGRITDVRRQI